jgi:type II secretory pathway pseudopilin PulG
LSRKGLALLVAAAALALAGWMGFSDGREHRAADAAANPAR